MSIFLCTLYTCPKMWAQICQFFAVAFFYLQNRILLFYLLRFLPPVYSDGISAPRVAVSGNPSTFATVVSFASETPSLRSQNSSRYRVKPQGLTGNSTA